MTYPINHGGILNIVVMDYEHERWEHQKSIVPAKRDELDILLRGWGRHTQRLIEVARITSTANPLGLLLTSEQLLDTPDLAAWEMCEAPLAPFFNKNRVVMMGDAAHATTPFQGQGAGQAIEDALVLVTLLARVTNSSEIPNAFTAFDQSRRLRSQRIVKTSREAGDLIGMRQEGVGNDIGKIREKLNTRMHWIWHRNIVAQNKEAVDLFEESL